jgi:hypothetical protein
MEKKMEIINNLTASQRQEFENDMLGIYQECQKTLNGKMERLKDVTVNMRLGNKVFLKVTFEYDNTVNNNEKVKGRIMDIYKYSGKSEYDMAVAVERSSLN